jgi:hypothetical protein
MSEQLVANGKYRVESLAGAGALGMMGAPHFVLLPETGDGFTWEITFDGTDSYTLKNVGGGSYVGDEAPQTEPAMLLRVGSNSFSWKIERGPVEGTFTLSPKGSNGTMRLALSLLRIFPPPAAWVPASAYAQDQLWRLTKV